LPFGLFWASSTPGNPSSSAASPGILPFNVVDAIVIAVVDWYLWAALVPLIYFLVRRYPLDQRNWPTSLALHLAVGTLCTLFVLVLIVPVFQNFTHGDPQLPQTFSRLFVMHFLGGFVWYLWVYWAIVGVCHSYEYYRKYQEREQRAMQLEHQLTQAELQVLKMQLHHDGKPHRAQGRGCFAHRFHSVSREGAWPGPSDHPVQRSRPFHLASVAA
jgi:hypothetical protein